MSIQRITGHRRTVVRVGDRRVVGPYDQVLDSRSIAASWKLFAPAFAGTEVLNCTGRVREVDCLDFGTLVQLARLRPNADLVVDMVDLLAAVGLEREAEVVVFTDEADDQFAVPVRNLMQRGRLVVGSIRDSRRPSARSSARLEVPGWIEAGESFHPVSMSASTFAEFISCR